MNCGYALLMLKVNLVSMLKTHLQDSIRIVPRIVKKAVFWSSIVFKNIIKWLIFLTLLLCALWAGVLLWIHLGDKPIVRAIVVTVVTGLSIITAVNYISRSKVWLKWLAGLGVLWITLATWFMWLPAQQDRPWQAEVNRYLSYSQNQQDPKLITLHNVRNFDWVRAPGSQVLVQPTEPYFYTAGHESSDGSDSVANRTDIVAEERWIDRTVNLDKLIGIDIINSYWMGKPVGHTLLSFRFKDDRPLSFSIEIRKEEDEAFSALGGFFKQFEMIVVAAEERDIVYTRSNVRGEQVYMFPVQGMTRTQIKELFMQYLKKTDVLHKDAKWYNTLIRNCTTEIFGMARGVTEDMFPLDYRILVSGYVPNYLYDKGLLPTNSWDIEDWYKRAHINPKVANFKFKDNQSAYAYSKIIREGLPLPQLNESL